MASIFVVVWESLKPFNLWNYWKRVKIDEDHVWSKDRFDLLILDVGLVVMIVMDCFYQGLIYFLTCYFNLYLSLARIAVEFVSFLFGFSFRFSCCRDHWKSCNWWQRGYMGLFSSKLIIFLVVVCQDCEIWIVFTVIEMWD